MGNSFNSRQRSATIRAVVAAQPVLAAVHDFETFAYRRAANAGRWHYRFSALLPNTGIIWNDNTLTAAQLQALNTVIGQHAKQITC